MPKSQLAHDLLKTAEDLIARKNPRQSNLKRAVSTAYYALFHCLSESCANNLITKRNGKAAWRQSYRALQHSFAKKACDSLNDRKQRVILEKFPDEIQDFALQFYNMQLKRHEADYDPYSKFQKSQVLTDLRATEAVIRGFEACSSAHRQAFTALVLFQRRD
ncbi:hypothetical protein [Xaviernesmea oryzae]|uniref:hypothetical protein n=1 Tax=Xaviernesmea oryzae TaxID=464029 RepID=UPI001113E839|nr:hypothetical protein [Xaviernesmea oryzae]